MDSEQIFLKRLKLLFVVSGGRECGSFWNDYKINLTTPTGNSTEGKKRRHLYLFSTVNILFLLLRSNTNKGGQMVSPTYPLVSRTPCKSSGSSLGSGLLYTPSRHLLKPFPRSSDRVPKPGTPSNRFVSVKPSGAPGTPLGVVDSLESLVVRTTARSVHQGRQPAYTDGSETPN